MIRRLLATAALAGIAFAASPQDASACILNMPCQTWDFQQWVEDNPETVEQFRQTIRGWIDQWEIPDLSEPACNGRLRLAVCDGDDDTPPATSVPEPGSMSLLVAGFLGLGFVRLRRREEDE